MTSQWQEGKKKSFKMVFCFLHTIGVALKKNKASDTTLVFFLAKISAAYKLRSEKEDFIKF